MILIHAKDWKTTYWAEAKKWSEQQDWSYKTDHERFLQEMAIAEFIANQEGKTTFLSYVGREYTQLEPRYAS